ncbi:DMT family transporter [Pikeienuella piscinae]|uniref:DMT family transporter n=1 Tax=Pikeienuella piscinae TaxID=2748098 RepID=A0A7L5BV66_9RHOB|nr:DMT family transporter [Pikeienuella piscinae]QIE55725.1 DMT family transporter [Pikeienuella piscinae]
MRAIPATRDENLRGAALMMAAMVAFILNDTLLKTLSGEVPVLQAVFVRGLFAVVLIGGLAAYRGETRLRALPPRDRWRGILRALAEVGATICFLTALFAMPIANVTAIMLASPMVLTMIGATLLGESVGWRRWSAIFAGFAGVLLIVKPGTEAFNYASLWAVGAIFFVCIRDLATRRLSPSTPSVLISLITAVAITILGGLAVLIEGWAPMQAAHVGRLALAALFVFAGYTLSVMTMRVGDMGFVTPFRYTMLIWALLLGWAVFGDTPGPLTLAGAGLVVCAGVYSFLRAGRAVG